MHVHCVGPGMLLLLIDSIEILRKLTLVNRTSCSCSHVALYPSHLLHLRKLLLLLGRSSLVWIGSTVDDDQTVIVVAAVGIFLIGYLMLLLLMSPVITLIAHNIQSNRLLLLLRVLQIDILLLLSKRRSSIWIRKISCCVAFLLRTNRRPFTLMVYRYFMLIWILSWKNTKGLVCIHLCIVLLMHVIVLPRRILLGQRKTLGVLCLPAKIDLKLIAYIIGGYWAAYLFNSVDVVSDPSPILIGVDWSVFNGLLLYGTKKFCFQGRWLFIVVMKSSTTTSTIVKLRFQAWCSFSRWVWLCWI